MKDLKGGPEGGPEGGPLGGPDGGPEGGPDGGPEGGPEGASFEESEGGALGRGGGAGPVSTIGSWAGGVGSTIASSGGEDETSGVEVSKSTGGCSLTTGVERSGSATGVESNESVPVSSTDSDFFLPREESVDHLLQLYQRYQH